MDFELSEDQHALKDAAAALLEDKATTAQVRSVMAGDGHLDPSLWAAMADQGWLAIEASEDDGGLGMGLVEIVILCEELGSHVAPVPFLGTVLTRRRPGRWRARRGIFGWGRCRDVAGAARWRGRRRGAGVVPSSRARCGRYRAVPISGCCRATPIPSSTARPPTWWWRGPRLPTPTGAKAKWRCSRSPKTTTSAPRCSRPWIAPAAWAASSCGTIPPFGSVRTSRPICSSTAPPRALCGEMLGAAQRVLAMTVEYAKDRVQFGRPIGSFQAVKHRCADMLVDVEGIRSSTYYAAWAVGADDPDAHCAASAAKVWGADAAQRVMASGLQVHGGIGFTWEHDLHLFLKRSQLDQVSFGDSTFHRDRLARLLRPRAEAGLPVL